MTRCSGTSALPRLVRAWFQRSVASGHPKAWAMAATISSCRSRSPTPSVCNSMGQSRWPGPVMFRCGGPSMRAEPRQAAAATRLSFRVADIGRLTVTVLPRGTNGQSLLTGHIRELLVSEGDTFTALVLARRPDLAFEPLSDPARDAARSGPSRWRPGSGLFPISTGPSGNTKTPRRATFARRARGSGPSDQMDPASTM